MNCVNAHREGLGEHGILQRELLGDGYDLAGGHNEVVRHRTLTLASHDPQVLADIVASPPAVVALPAYQVRLAGDPVPDFQTLDTLACRCHGS